MYNLDIGTIVFSIFATLVLYGLFPLLFAITRKQPIAKKTYRLYCIIATVAECIVISIIRYALEGRVSNGAPAIIWGTIFYKLGLHSLENKNLLIDENKTQNDVESEHLAKRETASEEEKTLVMLQKSESSSEQSQSNGLNGDESSNKARIGMMDRIPLNTYDSWQNPQDRIQAEHKAENSELISCETPLSIDTEAAPSEPQPVQNERSIKAFHPQPQQEQPAVRFCHKCGSKLIEGALYCNMCGSKVWTEEG